MRLHASLPRAPALPVEPRARRQLQQRLTAGGFALVVAHVSPLPALGQEQPSRRAWVYSTPGRRASSPALRSLWGGWARWVALLVALGLRRAPMFPLTRPTLYPLGLAVAWWTSPRSGVTWFSLQRAPGAVSAWAAWTGGRPGSCVLLLQPAPTPDTVRYLIAHAVPAVGLGPSAWAAPALGLRPHPDCAQGVLLLAWRALRLGAGVV